MYYIYENILYCLYQKSAYTFLQGELTNSKNSSMTDKSNSFVCLHSSLAITRKKYLASYDFCNRKTTMHASLTLA